MNPTIKDVIEATAAVTGIEAWKLTKRTTQADIATARGIAVLAARCVGAFRFREIAPALGMTPTTASRNYRRTHALTAEDPGLAATVAEVVARAREIGGRE